MRFLTSENFRGAMSPMTMVGWLFGIGTIEYPMGRPRRILSGCWALTHLLVIWSSFLVFYLNYLIKLKLPTIDLATYRIIMIYEMIDILLTIYCSQAKSKQLANCYKQLDTINETLKNIGIGKEYGGTLKSNVFQLIAFVFLAIMPMAAMDYALMNKYNEFTLKRTYSFIFRYHIFIANYVNNFFFINTLRYIRNRFRHLNAYFATRFNEEDRNSFDPASNQDIPCVRTVEASVQSRRDRKSHERRMIAALLDAKKIYQDLFHAAGNLNDVFDLHVLLSLMRIFLYNIYLLYDIYNCFLGSTLCRTALILSWFALPIVLPTIVYTILMIDLCSVAAATADQAQETSKLVNELVTPTTSHEMREEIQGFSLRIMYEPLQFTAYGFLNLDRAMLAAMAGTVTTYVVIMIQLGGTRATTNFASTALNASL